jgi:hypothetical protein
LRYPALVTWLLIASHCAIFLFQVSLALGRVLADRGSRQGSKV